MNMSERVKVILKHIIESLVVSVLAGVFVAVLINMNLRLVPVVIEKISILGFWGIAGLDIVLALCIGVIFPRWCVSMVKSLKYFPFQFGLISKVFVGTIVYYLCILYLHRTSGDQNNKFDLVVGLLILFVIVGITFIAGLFCEWLLKKQNHKSDDADDRPIERIEDNKIPSHSVVVERMLTELLSGPRRTGNLQPNIALIGPYGSGKTSICNMVKDLYEKRFNAGKNLPQSIFCRFEGWRFLSAEAAVEGLLDTGVRKILEKVDASELWNIPERYVRAIKEVSGRWGWIWTLLFGESKTPDILAKSIGDVLLRLNLRLVIFVDDFDRIEADEGYCQQAVAKALNQLQNVPNVQYVICVGPMLSIGTLQTETTPCKDLIKLTRYQELIPGVVIEDVINEIKESREEVLKDTTYYFPWAEIQEGGSDPLSYHYEFRYIYAEVGLTGKLTGLIKTPRVLKAVLRESNNAWNGGLKGEIDWYDLVLLNTLKAAEPGIFEWIERNKDVFLECPSKKGSQEEYKKIAKKLREQLRNCLQSKYEEQCQVVEKTLGHLFPAFGMKINADLTTRLLVNDWSQKISVWPNVGANYMERFFAGGVYEPDIADQPVLQYIKRINQDGLSMKEFSEKFLSSQDKLTGVLNKITQFAGLIQRELGFEMADAILEWIAEPEHAKTWPNPERYIYDMMPDIFMIINRCGSRQKRKTLEALISYGEETSKWCEKMLDKYLVRAPLLAILFSGTVIKENFGDSSKINKKITEYLKAEFIDGQRKFLPEFGTFEYSLNRFIETIQKHPEYQNFKRDFTTKIVTESKRDDSHTLKKELVRSLVAVSHPVSDGDIPIESYTFEVKKSENENIYDMQIMIPELKQWQHLDLDDEVVTTALNHIAKVYNFYGNEGKNT